MNDLIIKSTKFSFFLTVILIFPLINNTRTLLDAWLVEVPDHAVSFANLILVYTFIDCFTTSLYTAVLATSRIKTYEVVLTILYFLNVFCAYVALKLGMPPEAVFVLAILFKFSLQTAFDRTRVRKPSSDCGNMRYSSSATTKPISESPRNSSRSLLSAETER